jgi:hypothetical protein
MAAREAGEKNRLTIVLSEDLARRLELVAVSQNRTAASVVAALLDKHLPRPDAGQQKDKKKIPYT